MPDLPSGTVTFLFTDVEGSTVLWERNPSALRAASPGKICDNGGQWLRSPQEGVGLLREADGSKVTGSHAMEPSTILEASRPAEAIPAPGCALVAPGTGATQWLRTDLFFGCAKPDGTAISAAEWEAFLDAEITPRFPEGLTVLEAAGQWQEADGDIIEERSKVVLLLYPQAAQEESHAEIEAIRAAYEQRFGQDAVLRADEPRPVCASL